MQHYFETRAHWTGDLHGSGSLAAAGLEAAYSVPKSLDGPGIGTNPEELLLGAAATCFLITLSAVLKRSQIDVRVLNLRSRLEVSTEKGFEIKRIQHFPSIRLPRGADESIAQAAETALRQAEEYCMVAKAIKGNVSVEVVPHIHIER